MSHFLLGLLSSSGTVLSGCPFLGHTLGLDPVPGHLVSYSHETAETVSEGLWTLWTPREVSRMPVLGFFGNLLGLPPLLLLSYSLSVTIATV